jgi:hypothetical protein
MAFDLLRCWDVDSVARPYPANHIVVAVALAAAVGVVTRVDAGFSLEGDEGVDGLLQRVIAHTARSGITVQAVRELRAGTVSGKHQAWMRVETALAPSGAFSWRVVDEGGSERTRQKVLYALLKNESEVGRAGDPAALTPANYILAPLPPTRAGEVSIRLTPRRSDPKLINGFLTVSADGYPIRLEGRLSKAPSFWVRSVTMVTHYSRFAGIALPTSLETLADVKIVGPSTLTMRYQYTVVNGRTVSHAVALAPFVGPSAEILALHGAGPES